MTTTKANRILISIAIMAQVLTSCVKTDDTNEPTTDPVNAKSSVVFNSSKTYGTMTDKDGNVYKTIVIGKQTWMAENMRVTKYSNGTAIPNVTKNAAWTALTTGAYCNYNNTQNADTLVTFGRLYNWYAVTSTNKIAPEGWHVPTDAEWVTLTQYLGGNSVDADKMIEVGNIHWLTRVETATNESGFSATPTGKRSDEDGLFYGLGTSANYWSCSKCYDYGWGLNLSAGNSSYLNKFFKPEGFAVRLVKD